MFAKIDFETTCVTGHAKTRKARKMLKTTPESTLKYTEAHRRAPKSVEVCRSTPEDVFEVLGERQNRKLHDLQWLLP